MLDGKKERRRRRITPPYPYLRGTTVPLDNYPGINFMKALACSYFWWIGQDKDIENLGKSCESCPAVKSNPTTAPLHPCIYALWTLIHVDYAGPFLKKMLFIVVDAHSNWPEVLVMNSTTSQSTSEALRTLFGRY